jgi:hypothetical protein
MAEKHFLIGNTPLPWRQKRPTSYRRRWKKVLVAVGVSVVGLYFLLLTMVFIYQDQLIFAAPRTIPDTTPASANIPFEDLHIPVEASIQVHAWWIPAQQPSTKVILYFHGNGYALESEATEEAPLFHQPVRTFCWWTIEDTEQAAERKPMVRARKPMRMRRCFT